MNLEPDGTCRAIADAWCQRDDLLGEGEPDRTIATWPWHGRPFDVASGSTLRTPEIGVSAE